MNRHQTVSTNANKKAAASNGIAKKEVDFFAFAGQSNADGHFFTFEGDNTPGELGSVVFAIKVEALTGHRPNLLNVASGGAGSSEISNATNFWWNIGENKPGDLLLNAVSTIKAAMSAGKDLDGVVWAQGETDALAINDTSNLTEFFTRSLSEATTKIFEYFWSELGADVPILIQELGENSGYHGFDAVRDVQTALVNKFPNVHMGAETEGLAFLSDNIHYTTQSKGIIANDLAESAVLIIDGIETPPTAQEAIIGTGGDDALSGTDSDNVINGFEGVDVIVGSKGNDTIRGGDSSYNQVDYLGKSSDYRFVKNLDGTVTVEKPDGSVDTLVDIKGFWFMGELVWKPLEDVLENSGQTIVGTNGDDYLLGTLGDDTIDGLAGVDVIRSSNGSDIINGGGVEYDQVDYSGNSTDYTFSMNTDGTIKVSGPEGKVDTIKDIDGIWFAGDEKWRPIEDLITGGTFPDQVINGTSGNDYIRGTAGNDTIDAGAGLDVIRGSVGDDIIKGGDTGYNQVDYKGSADDFLFEKNADGSFTVTGTNTGTDLLIDIDGIWFEGEQVWYDIDDLAG